LCTAGAGAAIAPPPSLTETTEPTSGQDNDEAIGKSVNTARGLGVAAKIMAKYGYKHGQGLGRAEQGMSQALSVEKTSKRGGRIVHEKDRILLPPPLNPCNQFGESFKVPSQDDIPNATSLNQSNLTPPSLSQCNEDIENSNNIDSQSEYSGLGTNNTGSDEYGSQTMPEAAPKPSITELMKNPSKVVLCKNMVGPGEVDDELEPEVKEECNGKYGDVISVIVNEVPNAPTPEESVRIFIEFKRVESAIKAVIDLNGRFFGGREVKAQFFDQDKFENLVLTD